MGAVAQHPFFLRVIESLQGYNKNWVLPYITVMYSTGPLFLSVIWKEYMLNSPATESARVRILMPDEYNRHAWSFFSHHRGSSWHGKDARLIFWVSFPHPVVSTPRSASPNVISLDGKPLDAPDRSRIHARGTRRFRPLVGIWTNPPPRLTWSLRCTTASPDTIAISPNERKTGL
jgi:hypothetical protein